MRIDDQADRRRSARPDRAAARRGALRERARRAGWRATALTRQRSSHDHDTRSATTRSPSTCGAIPCRTPGFGSSCSTDLPAEAADSVIASLADLIAAPGPAGRAPSSFRSVTTASAAHWNAGSREPRLPLVLVTTAEEPWTEGASRTASGRHQPVRPRGRLPAEAEPGQLDRRAWARWRGA